MTVHPADITDLSVLPKNVQPMARVINKVRKGIMAKYKHPADWINAHGYDGAFLTADGLRRAAPDPTRLEEAREKIRQALVSVKGFVGAYYMGNMTPSHEIEAPVLMIKVGKDQKFEMAE